MWARIEENIVVELTDIDPKGRFHASLKWVKCLASTLLGSLYDGKKFSDPAEPDAIAPNKCSPAKGLVALFALKRITEDDVLAAIGRIEDPVQQYTARIGYQRATIWERGSPTMQAMAQLLQLSEVDLDELFTYAVAVQV